MRDDSPDHSALLRHQRNMIDAARGVFLDWDGCLAIGNKILPSTSRLIAQCAERVVIISNNSTQLPEDFARILQRGGLKVPAHRVVLAGAQAIRGLAVTKRSILMYGSARMKTYAVSLGLRLERETADTVLLMRDTRFNYGKLLRAANALHRGARLVVANADRTHPAHGNRLVPETGALLAALRACVPDAQPEIIGKPSPLLFMMACEILGITPDEAVMIGDNPETDGDGAVACGIRPIMIGGPTRPTLDDLAAAEAIRIA
jgi:HAD superfamily hydrolase (TIGR01450 family)